MKTTNLYEAAAQWAERPADQRFWTLEEMHAACKQYASTARQAVIPLDKCNVSTIGTDGAELLLNGPTGASASLSARRFFFAPDRPESGLSNIAPGHPNALAARP